MKKTLVLITICGILGWIGYGYFVALPRPNKVATVSTKTIRENNGTTSKQTSNSDVAIEPSSHAPANPLRASASAELSPELAFGIATNQEQAMQAIYRMEGTNPSSAIDARLHLLGACSLPTGYPDYYQQFPNSWHKTQLFQYCHGYEDRDLLDPKRPNRLPEQLAGQSTSARLYAELEALHRSRGTEAVFAEIEERLKTEQDGFAIEALFKYMMNKERIRRFDGALHIEGTPKLGLIADLPRGQNGIDQSFLVLSIVSQLANCEQSGGCGAYHMSTLGHCSLIGSCPPGASLRDYYNLTTPPAQMRAVDIVLARWRALRQCGRYQCG